MSPEMESLGSIPGAVLGVTLLLTAAWSLGGLLIRPARSGPWRGDDAALLRIAVGLNLLGVAGVILGLLGFLALGRSLWLLAALSLLALPEAWRFCRSRRLNPARNVVDWIWRLPWGTSLALTLAAVTLGPALCYPTGWDELVYHAVLPRRWMVDGWPALYADLPYSGFPSLGEILFWLVAPLESVIATRLVVWVCWILGLALLYRLLRRRLAGGSAVILTSAFALSPAVLMITANCYVESILMMDVAAILLAASLPAGATGGLCTRAAPTGSAAAKPAVARAAILGVLAGGAAAVKLTGLAVLVVPCLWYAGEVWQIRAQWAAAARSLAVYFSVALLVCFPFYLRPWLLAGNPFYPYFCEWFTGNPTTIEMSQYHHALGNAAFGLRSAVAFFEGPVLLAFNEDLYDGSFGWQLLALIALAALAVASAASKRLRRVIVWPAAVAACLYVFWFLTAQQARFAVPTILVLVVLAGLGLRRFRGKHRRWVLLVLLVAALVSAPWRTLGHYVGSWLTVLGMVSRTDYVDVETDRQYLPLVLALRDRTPPEAKLMLLFDHRGLYLPRPYVIGTPFFQEQGFSPPERFSEATRVIEVLREGRFTHLVMTKAPAGPDRAPDVADRLEPLFRSIEECVRQGRLQLVWESERYAVLEVR